MSDDELIELVQQASAEDISDEALNRMREKLAQSPALQAALRERLWVEEILAGTLDKTNISIDRLVDLARRQSHLRPTSGWRIWAWGVCLAVALATAGYSAHRLGWLSPQTVAPTADATEASDAAATEAEPPPQPSGGNSGSHSANADVPDDNWLDGDIPAIVIEAESFVAGNVEVDTSRYGRGIGIIRGPVPQAYFAEYDVPISEAGHYRLSIRYTSDKPRPLAVSLNGKVVTRRAANGDLQSWEPQRQTWSEVGIYELPAGNTRLRLETDEWRSWPAHYFPHVDKLRLERVVDGTSLAESNRDQRPWERPEHLGGPVRKFDDAWLEDISRSHYTPSIGDMYRWFGAAGRDAGYRFTEQRHLDRNCPVFDGWLKLRAPWPTDAMLRLALFDHKKLNLHFYHGSEGVTLQFLENRRLAWAAYHASRKGSNPRPTRLVLAATDRDRGYRTAQTPHAPFAVRWHDGELILSRGDVRLLAVALDGPPEEVFLEGRAGIRGLAFWRVDGVPPRSRERAESIVVDKPAAQAWTGTYPAGAMLEKHADGSVALTAAPLQSPAWATMKLPRVTLAEIVIQLDAPVPGTGIFLAGDDGKPGDMIRFVRDRRTGQLAATWTTAGDPQSEKDFDPAIEPVPFVSTQPWLKFVYGCGTLRCSLSADGIHWSRPWEPNHSLSGPVTGLGLFCKAGQTKRSIGLRRLVVRELDALLGLVPAQVRAAAKPIPAAASLELWRQQVQRLRPTTIDSTAWESGCALRSLAAGADRKLGTALLQLLVDDMLKRPLPLDERLRVLDDAAALAGVWDDHGDALAFAIRYREIGEIAYQSGEKQPYSRVRRAATQTPIWSRNAVPSSVAPLARLELLHATAERRWADVERLCREVKFWRFRPANDTRADEVVDWAHVVARRHLPRTPGEPVLPARPDWQPLYEEQLHKQTFNLMAEFHAAIEGEQYRDAAGIISSISESAIQEAAAGLLPDPRDPDLFHSLPVAVRVAMRDHPPLLAAMNEHFAGVAQQRVQRALTEGHATALEAATLQFHGTPAAAAAHGWLGDRALAVGEFSRALGHYLQAVAVPTMTDRAATQQRARLAAAMLGRAVGSPAKTDVLLGEVRVSPEDFEALLAQTLRRSSDWASVGLSAATIAAAAPKPARYGVTPATDFNGRGIDRPRLADDAAAALSLDWFSRQVAAVVDGDSMFLGSRYSTRAYDTHTASVRWTVDEPVGGGRSPELAAHRLLVVGSRIIRRSAPQAGPTLVALSRDKGEVLWRARFPSGAVAASDPVWWQNELMCLTADPADRQETTAIGLATLDITTGEVLRVRPLIRVHRSWWDQRVGQVAPHNDQLVATLGGITLSCNGDGQVQWVRRSERIPASVDSWTTVQSHDAPLLADGRWIVAQPGVRTVEALDPLSGRRHWSVVLPDLLQLVGVAGGRAIVRTKHGLLGCDLQDGRVAWSRPLSLDAQILACGAADRVLLAERLPDERRESRVPARLALVWLEGTTGQTAGQTLVDGLAEEHAAIGPLIAAPPARVWLLIGRDNERASRELCRLEEVKSP